jgi:hypothetical protein
MIDLGPIGTHAASHGPTDVSFTCPTSEKGPNGPQKDSKIDEQYQLSNESIKLADRSWPSFGGKKTAICSIACHGTLTPTR